MADGERDHLTDPEALGKADAIEVAAVGGLAAAPGLAELLVHGSGTVVALGGGVVMGLLNRYTVKQTERLLQELSERITRLEAADRLDLGRLERLEEMGAFQAMAANAVSSPEKTELYADVLAGVVSVDAPDALDVEAFIATLQNLSVPEIDLARQMHDLWEANEGGVASTGVRPPWIGDDQEYHVKRLEGAGLIVPRVRTGPIGAGVKTEGYEPSPTLTRLVQLLRSGRADPLHTDPTR